jgi:hypothetical protein
MAIAYVCMGSLYGYEVETELPLERLNSGPGSRGVLRIEAAGFPLREPDREPEGVLEEDGWRWYASYEIDGGCLLAMPPTAVFDLAPGPLRVIVDSRGEDPELLEHRIASSAICTLLSMRKDLVLHASSVEAGGRATIFCGPTTRGKSTMARVLGEAGHPVIGEDGIAISLEGEPFAFPGARGIRTRRGESRAVELVPDPGPVEPGPSPVEAVVLLGERGERLEVERLEPARALALLTPNLVHSGGRGSIGVAFNRLAKLLGSVPAFEARLPDDLDALPEAAERLLESTAVGGLNSAPVRG